MLGAFQLDYGRVGRFASDLLDARLLRALSARFPGKQWRFSIVIPEEIPEAFFSKLNFRKDRLSQIQMARTL